MDPVITNTPSALVMLRQQMDREIKNFSEIDQLIKEKTKRIVESTNASAALKEAMQLSYILLDYRANLIASLNSIRDTYKSFDENLKPRLKSQEAMIIQRIDNLKDLHSSLELIQRLSYANRV